MTVSFPGESFLVDDTGLPDYEQERFWIVVKAIVIVVVFVVILPVLMAEPPSESNCEQTPSEQETKSTSKNRQFGKSKRRTKTSTPKKKAEEQKDATTTAESTMSPEAPLVQLNLACMFCLVVLIMRSSNNRLTARTAYVAPLFTPEECQFIIDRAHEAAKVNLEQDPEDERLLRVPQGWRKDRHSSYPTTDLNVVTDPFTKEDRAFLAEKLNTRLAPLIERIYGISPAAIRANDMFVVRYDATEGQPFLEKHTDSSHVSFNVLLNEEFEGGGTRFHNRWTDEHKTVKPHVGHVLINNANMLHEGMATTAGTRYILVGFTSIDRFDPFTEKTTGLSLFASWLSLPWVQVRMKQGTTVREQKISHGKKIYDNRYFSSLFRDIHVAFTLLGDFLSPHRVVTMVDPDNSTEYIAALDEQTEPGKASWFRGQQIHVDVDGTITEVWNTRANNEAAFREL